MIPVNLPKPSQFQLSIKCFFFERMYFDHFLKEFYIVNTKVTKIAVHDTEDMGGEL